MHGFLCAPANYLRLLEMFGHRLLFTFLYTLVAFVLA